MTVVLCDVTGSTSLGERLEQAAVPSEILIGEDTHRMTRDAVEAEPVEPLKTVGSGLFTMRGEFDAARAWWSEGNAVEREIGARRVAVAARPSGGRNPS